VTSVRTSWFSSRSSMVPKYPNRLSANFGDASSFKHSICPKCVLSPRVKRYKSLATLLRLRCPVRICCFVHSQEFIPDVGIVALFSEACSNRSTFFLDDCSLVCNRFCGSHISNELFDYQGNWVSCHMQRIVED
jgi:hypothetical protein